MIVAIILITRQEALTRGLKIFVIFMLLFSISFTALFEYMNRAAEKRTRPIILAFKAGKDLHCNQNIINNKSYFYEPGTSSFQPNGDIVGDTYALKECTITP